MNVKNLEYLTNQVKYTGFGDSLADQLKAKLEKQGTNFTLAWEGKMEDGQLKAVLHFGKGKEGDLHFFNRYDLYLTKANNESMKQSFYVGNKGNITVKEGYNLMCGRAVYKTLESKEKVEGSDSTTYQKTGQTYNAWIKLNFSSIDKHGNCELRKFYDTWGFDLQKQLREHGIKEAANDDDKKMLMESLQRGNRQKVTIDQNGTSQKFFIEANPSGRSLNFYNTNMQRIDAPQQGQKEGESVENSQKQSAKQAQGKKADDGEPAASKKQGQRKSQKVG